MGTLNRVPSVTVIALLWACLVALTLASCAQPLRTQSRPGVEADTVLPIQTDRSAYTLGPVNSPYPGAAMFVLVATYRNLTGGTIHLADCEGMPPSFRLEKKVGGEWVLAYDPACWSVARARLQTLAPGEERVDTLRIHHYPSANPRFSVPEVSGTYRLVYNAFSSWEFEGRGDQQPVAIEASVSNAFEIRTASSRETAPAEKPIRHAGR